MSEKNIAGDGKWQQCLDCVAKRVLVENIKNKKKKKLIRQQLGTV